MLENPLKSDNAVAESSDLAAILELLQSERFRANWRAFQETFLQLVLEPRRFAPLVVDYWLLVQFTWNKRQPGPDLIYPMLSIRKRRSERLAGLILEHSRNEQSYELRATTPLPEGIDPPCVAVIDLDEVPRELDANGYSTQANLHGHMCMLILVNTVTALAVHVFCRYGWGWATLLNWVNWAIVSLFLCIHALLRGDGTLTLARRSDTSVPGYAVLLDQDFTVILSGSQSIVEAIAESSFNLSHPNTTWGSPLEEDHSRGQDSPYQVIQGLCEGVCLAVPALCWLLFVPSATLGSRVALVVVFFIATLSQEFPLDDTSSWQEVVVSSKQYFCRLFPSCAFLLIYERVKIDGSILGVDWYKQAYALPTVLSFLFLDRYRDRNYPIRSEKLIDALGYPRVRKWQFDTLAAAATFQCLVLCRGITRPIRRVDVLAFLDMLVPDERDVWKAWKARVADRIRHEEDIDLTPTIPTFGDERQRQLKDLLDQAQFGNDTYRRFYG